MGTKNHPGAYDCESKAGADEPKFTLLGRDPHAGDTVRAWALKREQLTLARFNRSEIDAGERDRQLSKVDEARSVAIAMDAYFRDHPPAVPKGTFDMFANGKPA